MSPNSILGQGHPPISALRNVVRKINDYDTSEASHRQKVSENVPSVPGFPGGNGAVALQKSQSQRPAGCRRYKNDSVSGGEEGGLGGGVAACWESEGGAVRRDYCGDWRAEWWFNGAREVAVLVDRLSNT